MRIFQSEEKFSNYYQIDSCLDTTGNGAVYKALNTRLGNEVALKVFRSELFPKLEDYQNFERKAQVFGRLNHPNIARFFHYGQFEELPFIAMELVPGQSLDKYLQAQAPLSLQTALRLTTHICTALQYVNKFAQTPKTVKPNKEETTNEIDLENQKLCPSNIMVIEPNRKTSKPIIRLIDFGLVSDKSDSVDVHDRYQAGSDNLYTISQLLLDMLVDQITQQQLSSDWFDLSSLPTVELEIAELEPTINCIIQMCTNPEVEGELTTLADWQTKVGELQESIKSIEDARAYQQQGEYRATVESWQKATDLLPNNKPLKNLKRQAEIEEQIALADRRAATSDFEAAVQYWKNVLELVPSNTNADFHRATSEIGRLKLLAQIKPLQQEIQDQKKVIRQMSASQQEIDIERDNFDRDLLSREQQIDRLQVDLSAADLEADSTKQEWEEEVEQLTQHHQQQLEKLENLIKGKSGQIDTLRKKGEDLIQTRQKLTDELENLLAEKETLQNEMAEKDIQLNQKYEQVEELTAQVSNLEQIEADRNKIIEEQKTNLEQWQKDVDQLQILVEESKLEKDKFQTENSKLESDNEQLIEECNHIQKDREQLKKQILDQSEQLAKQLLELNEIGEQKQETKANLELLEKELEVLKTTHLALSKTAGEKDTQIELLERRKNREREVFQKLEQNWQQEVSFFEQNHDRLLKNQIQAETENIGFQHEWSELKESVRDLNQQLIQHSALLETKEEQIEQFIAEKTFIDQQIEELEERFQLQATTLSEKDNLNQDLIILKEQLQAQMKELQAYISDRDNKLEEKQKQLEQLEELKSTLESDLLLLASDRDDIQQKLGQKEQVLGQSEKENQAEIEALENQVSILKKQVLSNDQQLQQLTDHIKENNNNNIDLLDQHQEFEKKLENRDKNLVSLTNENSTLNQQLQDTLHKNSQAQAEIEARQNQIEKLEKIIPSEIEKISTEKETHQKALESELHQRDDEIQVLTQEKVALSNTVEEQSRMLKNAANKFKQQQQAIETLKSTQNNKQDRSSSPPEPSDQPQQQIPHRSTANEYVDLGIAYRKEERYQEAILAYQKAIELDPAHEWAYNNIGYAYYCAQDYEASVNAYKQAIQVRPDHGWAYNGLGRAYNKLGQYQQAIEAFLSSTQVSPDNAEAFYNLAKAYAISEEYDLVLSYLNQATAQDTAYATAAADEPLFVDLTEKPEFQQLIVRAES